MFNLPQGYVGVKPGWTRISFPYYMSNEEFEFTLEALEFIAIYGQRFLPLYNFNIKTGTWCFMTAFEELITGKLNSQKLHAKQATVPAEDEYAIYLENARHIASLLPEFPPQHRLPEDVDPSCLHFRI